VRGGSGDWAQVAAAAAAVGHLELVVMAGTRTETDGCRSRHSMEPDHRPPHPRFPLYE
jgi:hypothetical protein